MVLAVALVWAVPSVGVARQPRQPARSPRAADAPSAARHSAGATRAPSAPALTSGTETAIAGTAEEGAGISPQAQADPLVGNGLGSPLCTGALGSGELSRASRRDCETSGFVAAAAPTNDYGLDVHIDTGLLGFSTGGLLTVVQDLVIAPVWMALVWAVHALVVMLEWCFTIDLLDSRSVSGGVGAGLRRGLAQFTQPWLAVVLSAAALLALYNGIVRRRVAETLGQALLALAMMAAAMWVMLDPVGTLGALGGWANQASLGTLAVSAQGGPSGPGRALASSMSTVFAEAVELPWCYLEFGAVSWCRNPARLSPQLHADALHIAASELSLIGCKAYGASASACAVPGSAQAGALEHSAELLRSAQSNGAIFLALPANGPARNSINEAGSLLRTMCQSSEATSCRGPMAAQAEFRTNGGTWPRIGGLLLIVAGVLGMLLLFGFIAVRLLAAALFSLLYLLLAPAAVLAPALGDAGRAVFRKWAGRLLGAVVSKLLFSFLLGAVLAVLAILADLEALGWWTQWLLMSAFWWGAYVRRHQALSVAGGALGREPTGRQWPVVQRIGSALESPRKVIGGARWTISRLSGQGTNIEQRRKLAQAGRERAASGADEQSERLHEHEFRAARARTEAAPLIQGRLSAKRSQLERIRRERARALAGGWTRRASELAHRAQRIEFETAREQLALNSAREVASAGPPGRADRGAARARASSEQRERFLDAQAALPDARARGASGAGRRDYAALAGLLGYAREEYERLDPRARRAARLEVDRELALRKQLGATAEEMASGGAGSSLRRAERRKADRAFDGALEQQMRASGHGMPSSRKRRSGIDRWREAGLVGRSTSAALESNVMRDAHAVASRRKRQLGPRRD